MVQSLGGGPATTTLEIVAPADEPVGRRVVPRVIPTPVRPLAAETPAWSPATVEVHRNEGRTAASRVVDTTS
jgi:hypothetical protein